MTTDANAAASGADNNAAAPAAAAAAAPQQAWYEKSGDTSLAEFAVNKGYNKGSIEEVAPNILRSYHSLEKLVGAEKAGRTVEVPDFEKGDEVSLKTFYDRIGRPADPSKYDLKVAVDGKADTDFSNAMAGMFHKNGVTAKQATALAAGYQEFAAAREAANTATAQQQYEAEDKGLKTEWGSKYEDNMALASAAAKSFGVKPEALDALQKVAGYGVVMKMFQGIAGKIGEANFISGSQSNPNGKMTPAEASAALKSFMADKDTRAALMDKYHPKHAEFMARKAQLAAWEVGQ